MKLQPTSDARLRKIKVLSLNGKSLTRIMIGGLLVMGILNSSMSPKGVDLIKFWLILGYVCGGIFALDRLFSNFAEGRVLVVSSVRWVKIFGFWLMGCPILNPVINKIMAASDFTGSGTFFESPMFHFFGGAFLVLLGLVLEEACEIKEEQDLTI